MKVILISFFESNNIGDLLISNMLNEKVLEYTQEITKIDITSGEIIDITNLSIGKYKEENGEKILRKKLSNAKSKILDSRLCWKAIYNRNVKMNSSVLQHEVLIKNTDILIIDGGNMIFDLYKYASSASKIGNYIELAKKYKKKTFGISLGIGPFKRLEQLAIEVLSKSDYISFRDQKSLQIFQDDNCKEEVFLTPNPVFLLPKMTNQSHKKLLELIL